MRRAAVFEEVKEKAGIALILLGVVLAFYPLGTYLYAWQAQLRLQGALPRSSSSIRETRGVDGDSQGMDGEKPWAFLDIPSIGLSAAVVPGAAGGDLMKGPGWLRETAEPGEGNTVIAGHRTMYGGWFYRLPQLKPGDVVNLTYRNGVYRYRVERIWAVGDDDWGVVAPCGYPALTLVTCAPGGAWEKRLVVRARLTGRDALQTSPSRP